MNAQTSNVGCGTLLKDALVQWGISNEDYLTGLGYKKLSNGTDWLFSGNATDQRRAFLAFIKAQVYDGKAVSLTPDIEYRLLWQAYQADAKGMACDAKQITDPTDSQLQAAKSGAHDTSGTYHLISRLTADSKSTEDTVWRDKGIDTGGVFYSVIRNADESYQTPYKRYNGSCAAVASRLNDLATTLVKQIQEDAINQWIQWLIDPTLTNLRAKYEDAVCPVKTIGQPDSGCTREAAANQFNSYVTDCANYYAHPQAIVIGPGEVQSGGKTNPALTGSDLEVAVAKCIASKQNVIREQDLLIALRGAGQKLADLTKGNEDNAPGQMGTPGGGGDDAASCQISGVGWIVCPVVNFTAGLVDGAYGLIENLLVVEPLSTNTDVDDNPTYAAWTYARNFANVAFVIAFLVIVFSQVTSLGITNYGIKKLLPRLVIAALLVNVSYWICAVAVDISNILGESIKPMVDSIHIPVGSSGTDYNDTTWSRIGGALVATAVVGGVGLVADLTIFLPMLLCALLAVATVIVVLVVRKALIILLIVVAPLAFVAFLLPNTQKMFSRWLDLFKIMLLLFPIVAAVFGLSHLAGQVIMHSATDTLTQIVGAAVTVVPLAITPVVMKAAGGFLGKIGAVVNNPNRGPFDRARKAANSLYESRRGRKRDDRRTARLGRGGAILQGQGGRLGAAGSRRRRVAAAFASLGATSAVDAAQKSQWAKSGAESTAQEYVAERARNDDSYAKRIAGDQATSLQASSQAAVEKIETQQIAEREVLWRAKIDPTSVSEMGKALTGAINGNDAIGAMALQNMLIKQGSSGVDAMGQATMGSNVAPGSDMERRLRTNLGVNHGQTLKQKAFDQLAWVNSGGSLSALHDDPATWTGQAAEDYATQSTASLVAAADSGAITPEIADQLLTDSRFSGKLNDRKKEVLTNLINRGGGPALGHPASLTAAASGGSAPTTPTSGGSPGGQASAPAPSARQDAAQAKIAEAAAGTAGPSPFVATSTGDVTSTDRRAAAAGRLAESAGGTSGSQPFVVNHSGATTRPPARAATPRPAPQPPDEIRRINRDLNEK